MIPAQTKFETSNATNNYLVLTATGEAAKNINWVASIETVETGVNP